MRNIITTVDFVIALDKNKVVINDISCIRRVVLSKMLDVGDGVLCSAFERGQLIRLRHDSPTGEKRCYIPIHQAISFYDYRQKIRRRYTTNEDDFILEKAGKIDVPMIAQKLERSLKSVQKRIRMLGITCKTNQGLLTTGDAAELCGVTPQTIKNWCKTQSLPYMLSRGKRRYFYLSFAKLRNWLLCHRDKLAMVPPKNRRTLKLSVYDVAAIEGRRVA